MAQFYLIFESNRTRKHLRVNTFVITTIQNHIKYASTNAYRFLPFVFTIYEVWLWANSASINILSAVIIICSPIAGNPRIVNNSS